MSLALGFWLGPVMSLALRFKSAFPMSLVLGFQLASPTSLAYGFYSAMSCVWLQGLSWPCHEFGFRVSVGLLISFVRASVCHVMSLALGVQLAILMGLDLGFQLALLMALA